MMLRTCLVFLAAICLSVPASGSDFSEQTFTCPVDGRTFSTYVPVSGTYAGFRLDFRKIGPYPEPWEMPICPGNGFVIYDESYQTSEVATIKALVKTPEFVAVRDRGNQWLTAAFEMRQLGAKPDAIASMYLSATWAEEEDPGKYQQVAEEAHAYLSSIPDKEKGIYYLVLGELERRLGRFDAAHERFTKLPPGYAEAMATSGWKKADLRHYVKRQLHFIGTKNTGPQPINSNQAKFE